MDKKLQYKFQHNHDQVSNEALITMLRGGWLIDRSDVDDGYSWIWLYHPSSQDKNF